MVRARPAELFGEHSGSGAAPVLDSGGASRFFYCPKADREERDWAEGFVVTTYATHGEWVRDHYHSRRRASGTSRRAIHTPRSSRSSLCAGSSASSRRPAEPSHPFTGSGSTGIAALREGFDFIGVEREAEYVEIARARIQGG